MQAVRSIHLYLRVSSRVSRRGRMFLCRGLRGRRQGDKFCWRRESGVEMRFGNLGLTRPPDDGRPGEGVAPAGLGAAAALELAEDVLHVVLGDGERGLHVARRRLRVDERGAVGAVAVDDVAVALEVRLERVRRATTEDGGARPRRVGVRGLLEEDGQGEGGGVPRRVRGRQQAGAEVERPF